MLIKQALNSELGDLKIDNTLVKKIINIESSFVNKNPEHIEFFGGTLTGVQVVRFTSEDREKLFTDILQTDENYIEGILYSLKDKYGEIILKQERNVSSDIFNLCCIWLIHAIDNSRYIPDKEKQEAKIRVCLYMLYRFLTSLLFRYFRYPADKATAQATYEILSGKYVLKQQGSWAGTLRYMAENAVSEKGIHSKVVNNMDDDLAVINMLNDVQGRIRDMLKNIIGEFYKIHEQGIKITKSSSFIETDGEIVLKDKNKSLTNYTRYIKSIIVDKNSFIKQELVDVICNMMQAMPEKLLNQTLEWISNNYGHVQDNALENTIDSIMEHAFSYLSENKRLLHQKADISELITKLRGTYMSSRSTDSKVILARRLSEEIVVTATKSKNDSVISATKTGVMLYIVLRAITMKHYSN